MRGSRCIGLVGLLAALMLIVGTGLAQTTLSYGSGVVDEVDDETPFLFFNFGGGAGDLVTVRVVSLGAGFSPSVSINSLSGEQIAFDTTDLTSPGIGNVRIDVILPQGGTYNIRVGSRDGSQGQFLIRIDGLPTQNAPVLEAPATMLTPVNFLPGQSVQIVGFSATPGSDLELVAQAESLSFSVALHAEDGTLVGIIGSEDGDPTSFSIPAGDMNYFAVLGNRNRDEAPVEIGLLAGDTASTPATTNSGESATTTGECTITTGGNGINLRTGPGTNYNVIIGLPASSTYTVTGQNSNWYTINYNGAQGWMAGSVTTLSGACDTVPVVPAPAPPQASDQPADPVTTPDSTPPPTGEAAPSPTEPGAPLPTDPPPPTEEAAPSPTEPGAPTPTDPPPTEEAAPVAPPDSPIFVDVSIKNGQANVGDVVSYPNGDTEDEVFMSAVDFDSVTTSGNIQMIFTCTGDGQGNVSFRMGSSTYSCDDVNDEFVTNDSDNRTIRITATGGDNILVNWNILFIGSN